MVRHIGPGMDQGYDGKLAKDQKQRKIIGAALESWSKKVGFDAEDPVRRKSDEQKTTKKRPSKYASILCF
jgi:hypothetical protein